MRSGRSRSTQTGVAITFTAAASIAEPSDTLSYAWSFDGAAKTPGAVTMTHAFATAGTHTATVTVTDGLGFTKAVTATVTITTSAPRISALTQAHKRWRLGSRLASYARKAKNKPPIGTTFTFTVDQAATLHARFTRLRSCPRPRKHHHAATCSNGGTLAFGGHAGTGTISFQGHLTGKAKLTPGGYRLSLTATNAAGQTSAAVTVSFTIVA